MTKKTKSPAPVVEEVVTAFKGFNKDWTCRGFQYAIGQTFTHEGSVEACSSGLHSCERPLDVLRYYRPGTSRFADVKASGSLSRHADDSKIASTILTIGAEIGLPEIIAKTIAWTLARCTPAEGGSSKADNTVVKAEGKNQSCAASGDYGAATASGDSSAATASGNYGAATASGRNGKASGKAGCALFLTYRDSNRKILHAKGAIVGQDGIKEDTFYSLDAAGNFVEA